MTENGYGDGVPPTRVKYSISSVLNEGNPIPSLLPTFPSLSSNAYLPSSISSLSTSFTSAGTMPKASSTSKSVAQRRSQAPAVTISETRKVTHLEFQDYLEAVGSEYSRWEKERKLGRRGTADLGNQMEIRRDSLKLGLGLGLDMEINAEEPSSYEEENLPPLDAVPPIFFEPDFNLSNPRTFDLVTEKILPGSPVISRSSTYIPKTPKPGLGPLTLADLATDQILQEKLSHFTAVVESHLVREIGLRSSSFFSALANLQDLHLQGEACLKKIGELETSLSSDPEGPGTGIGVGGAAKRGLGILRSQARRRGLEHIEKAVKQVEAIHFGIDAVRKLVDNGDWMSALEIGEEVGLTYLGKSDSIDPSTKINLTKIKSLNFVLDRLSNLRLQVAKSLESEFIGVLDREMELGVGAYMKSVVDGGWKGEQGGAEMVRTRASDLLKSSLKGLVRADGIEGAVAAWREAVLRDIRSMVREHLPTPEQSTLEDEESFVQSSEKGLMESQMSDKSLTLAKNLKALTHSAFLVLIQDTYAGLLGCIEVVDIHSKVFLDLTVGMREAELLRKSNLKVSEQESSNGNGLLSPNSLLVPGDEPSLTITTIIVPTELNDSVSLTSDLSDVVHAAAELANIRFSKVIAVRTEIHSTKLSLEEFLEIFDSTWSFIVQCEIICKRMIIGLRGVMVGQAKTFLGTFHQKKITEGAKVVEEEQWMVAEVESEVQSAVALIMKCAVADPAELLLGIRKRDESNKDSIEQETQKQITIEDLDYFAVGAGLKAVVVLVEYLKIIINCPLLTTDAMSKIIEYMKSFNSRTCQVVLGAGAMRSAGLKNITAKHLALASQALSIMISLIPYIRETLRRHLNLKQAVMLVEFDKLKRDYQEHQNEIHSKLVAIMSDRLQIHCKTLQGLDWELPVPARNDLPNIYMESLVKEHVTLHKVLSRFLQAGTVETIMSQVVASLKARLVIEYERITLKTEIARERMVKDVKYLKEKLGGLKGLESLNSGTELEKVIATKILPSSARPSIDTPRPKSEIIPSPELHQTPSLTITESEPLSTDTTNLSLSIQTALPPSPVESPTIIPSPVFSAPPMAISLSAQEPPRRLSMAERLAALAGRRKSSNDMDSSTVISPPTPPKSIVKASALPPPPEEVEESPEITELEIIKEAKEKEVITESSSVIEASNRIIESSDTEEISVESSAIPAVIVEEVGSESIKLNEVKLQQIDEEVVEVL